MRRALGVLAVLNVLTLAALAGLSWVQAGAAGYAARPHGHITFHLGIGERLAKTLVGIAPSLWLDAFPDPPQVVQPGAEPYPPRDPEDRLRTIERRIAFAIGGDLVQADQFIDSYAIPVLFSSALALIAMVLVARREDGNDPALPRLIVRWGVVFTLVMAFALPVLVPDFWLSFAWGRTMWWGGNPYYDVPAAAVEGLPFDAPILKMTYGPLWALISWGITAITGGSILWSAILFKVLLVAAWAFTLVLVARLTSERPPRERSLALLVTAWLPLGPVQIGGDGHNDVLMILGIVGWMLLKERGQARAATFALALSVGVKYVSAPLFLLDLLHEGPGGTPRTPIARRVVAYLPNAAIALATWVVCFAPFFRSADFFLETAAVREGYFFLPADAVKAIGTLSETNLLPFAYAVMLCFPVATAVCLWRWWHSPSSGTFRLAAAGIMASVLFIAAGHVWPWYALWLGVPVAALADDSLLRRWATGVVLTAPFPLLYWTAWPDSSTYLRYELPSLAAYGLALVWMAAAWRLARPAPALAR